MTSHHDVEDDRKCLETTDIGMVVLVSQFHVVFEKFQTENDDVVTDECVTYLLVTREHLLRTVLAEAQQSETQTTSEHCIPCKVLQKQSLVLNANTNPALSFTAHVTLLDTDVTCHTAVSTHQSISADRQSKSRTTTNRVFMGDAVKWFNFVQVGKQLVVKLDKK